MSVEQDYREAGRELARRTRAAHGLPPTVTDPVVIDQIATLLRVKSPGREATSATIDNDTKEVSAMSNVVTPFPVPVAGTERACYQNGITTEIVHLTPEVAAKFLSCMPANRHLSKTNVATLVRIIRDGEWQVGLSTMSFDVHGNLIDGQHRCHAVIEAGIPVDVMVVRGLPPEAMVHMDTGKKRSLADLLSIRDEQNVTTLAGILVRVAAWRIFGSPQVYNIRQVTRTAALAVLDNEPGIRDTPRIANRLNYAVGGSPSMWGSLVHVLRTLDVDAAEDAELFFEMIIGGSGLREDDPPYVLRERLLSAVVKTGSRVRGMREDEMAAIVIKAWNAYRRGDRVRMLRWRPGGAKNEVFPEPI